MTYETLTIETGDGPCPTSVFTPQEGTGPWPAAVLYMDGFGIRPALRHMAQQLADAGYVVLLPDLYHRHGPYEPLDVRAVFATGDVRTALAPLMGSTDNRRAAEDTAVFLAHLEGRTDTTGKVGVTGYCMGGGMALTVAGTYPERIAAAASFHGGGLATDSELSPHLLVKQMSGRIYIGAADHDNSYPPAMAARLVESLMDAGTDHCHETYAGASHGWAIPDLPVYDAAAAERHWSRLLDLFDTNLR